MLILSFSTILLLFISGETCESTGKYVCTSCVTYYTLLLTAWHRYFAFVNRRPLQLTPKVPRDRKPAAFCCLLSRMFSSSCVLLFCCLNHSPSQRWGRSGEFNVSDVLVMKII